MSESRVSNSCWSEQPSRRGVDASARLCRPRLALLVALICGLSFGAIEARAQEEAPAAPATATPEAVVPPTAPIAAPDPEQQARLEAARRARSAALQQIATEQSRLTAYDRVLSAAEAQLDTAGARRDVEAEAALGLRQQAIEARSNPSHADTVYDDLRAELRAVRRRLNATLAAAGGATTLPPPPSSVTTDLAPGASVSAVEARRRSLESRRERLIVRQHEGYRIEARLQLAQLTLLNQARLDLLPHLSTDKRRAITGFTPTAWNQVSAEFEHLQLILRYHAFTLMDAVQAGAHRPSLLSASAVLAASTFMWVLALVAFAVWRTTARRLLPAWERDLQERNLATLRSAPELRLWLLQVFMSVRGPLEWLVMLFVLRAFLPDRVQNLLEIQVLGLIVGWILIAAVVTRLLNALLGAGTARLRRRARELGPLRLRSMRLISNVLVGFILVLTLTDRLVGKGAFYHWVAAIGWPAAILTLAVLVGWWRTEVYEQLERQRRPNALQRWVLANRAGWTGPLAALAGTADVVARSLLRSARTVGNRFISVRRTVAFLFRQELNRTDRNITSDLTPLPAAAFADLSPESFGEVWIPTRLQPVLDQLVDSAGPGLMVMVGERGSGKTAALMHLEERLPGARRVSAGELLVRARPARTRSEPAVMLVDDVEALVRFDVGGLAAFDQLVDRARESADRTLWILSIDSAAWALISRLRPVRTLFDSVIEVPHWTDTAIAALLKARVEQAGITPRYDRMIEDAADLDPIDLQEAVEAKHAAFMLLLWDASDGNPGVALHMWRSVMGVGPDGTVFVRALRPEPEAAIERLPLEALFVYRAVLRQTGAVAAEVVAATNLPAGLVADVLRSGVRAGHLLREGQAHRVSWDWYRALTRSLVRRHLGSAA